MIQIFMRAVFMTDKFPIFSSETDTSHRHTNMHIPQFLPTCYIHFITMIKIHIQQWKQKISEIKQEKRVILFLPSLEGINKFLLPSFTILTWYTCEWVDSIFSRKLFLSWWTSNDLWLILNIPFVNLWLE